MASIVDDGNGYRRILFFLDGQRKTVRLGKATDKQAKTAKVHIEQLVSAYGLHGVTDDATIRWLTDIDDQTHDRLARTGLVAKRESAMLGPWLASYMAGRSDLKPGSRAVLEWTIGKLLAQFDAKTPLRAITRNQASEWRTALQAGELSEKPLSEASVKNNVGNAKGLLAEAVRRGLIASNPFDHLASGATAAAEGHYVTPAEADKIIDAARGVGLPWVTLFGLSRLAGLRTPSETHLLTWADVDWARGRLNVRSPKTERHAGHERRTVPITPKLLRILQDQFDAAEPGEERIITLGQGGHLDRGLKAIIRRAGIEPWKKLWQTLRSSCEKEWAMSFPQFAVSLWIGHSITVSGKHYANSVPDELFAKAAGQGPDKAAQKAAHNIAKTDGIDLNAGERATAGINEIHEKTPDSVKNQGLSKIGVIGFEPTASWSRNKLPRRAGNIDNAVFPMKTRAFLFDAIG